MKNRLFFLVVAGALAMPAVAAPAAEWSLYGTLVTEVYDARTSGATAGKASDYQRRTQMTAGTSNLGFKGSMQVADDAKVIWQVESQIFTDGGADATKGQGIWGNRNTAVGLAGSWGTAMVGQWDTPYKTVQMGIGHMRASIQSDVAIINQPGFNTLGTTTASVPLSAAKDAAFNRRQGNSIQYWTPSFMGLQAKLMYSVNEAKTADSTALQRNPTLFSGSLAYVNKALGLTVLYGYEQHNDYFGLNVTGATSTTATSSKDTGHELAVYWVAPTKTRITAIAEQLKYTTDNGGVYKEYKRNAWFVSANQPINANNRVWAGFGVADKGDMIKVDGTKLTGTASKLGAKQYQLGYSYMFNPVTELYAFYAGIKNDKGASYNLMPQVGGLNAGADVRTIGVGLFYKF